VAITRETGECGGNPTRREIFTGEETPPLLKFERRSALPPLPKGRGLRAVKKMKLRDYLINRRITQEEFAKLVDVSRSHLSCVISGHRTAGRKLARNIEEQTNKEIKAIDIMSGFSVGYEGPPIRVKTSLKEEQHKVFDEKKIDRNIFSLI